MWDLLTEKYSLYSLFKPHWLIILSLLSFFYFKYIVKPITYQVTKNQKRFFIIAVFFIYLVLGSPINVIGKDFLFSAFVFKLASLFFIIIPLLMLSIPKNFYRKHLWHYKTRLLINVAGHPWLTLFLFNGLLTLFLIPKIHLFFHNHIFLSIIFQTILFISACLMWWVIINPLPEMSKLNYILRASYIFFASIFLVPIGFYYIVVQKTHFSYYEKVAGQIIPNFTAVYDQQLAGAILKLTQLSSYVIALLFILIIWRQKEEEKINLNDKSIRYVRGVVVHTDDDPHK